MAIVTIIKCIPSPPATKDERRYVAAMYMQELLGLWMEKHGAFIAGKRFHFLTFPPGAYTPAEGGVIRDATAFERGDGNVRWAIAVTDERPPPGTPPEYAAADLEPDPSFFPPGV